MAAYSHIVAGTPPTGHVPISTMIERTREFYDGPLTVSEDPTRCTITDTGVRVKHPG